MIPIDRLSARDSSRNAREIFSIAAIIQNSFARHLDRAIGDS
jgi:hypothetical protein